ncbi:RNA-directed DNA polymerase, eukaryota, reverse transcriptase zinc-binding domain protein [Tanacetum coccineum]
MVKKRKSFRLANYITDKVEFKEVIKENWDTTIQGHAMYKLVKKLKVLKPHLNKLNWKNGNLFQRVNDLKAKLCEIQGRIDKDPTNTMLRTEGVNVLNKFNEAADDEEKLLRQKAKVTWLAEGDKNSAYFHKFLKGRLNRSRIMSICAEDGKRYENCEVPGQFVKHFEGFLGIIPDVTKLNKEDNVLFKKTISLNEANLMIREITEEEIKKALFDIDDNKAPDPNGFTSKFYKKSCQIIRMDFCDAIKEFFSSGKLLGECISKILTNRIKVALSQIVDENQSAFVPGRAITDNILLTQELLKGYNCINGPKRCAYKIDIQKAYDTVSWEFLKDIMGRFGFPSKMTDWITTCISTPKFTICVNGERYGYFKGGRGLRQGDPISPYIFTMVMEMLNLIVKNEIMKNNTFKYHFSCRQLKITHLCFSDDLIMFSHEDKGSVTILRNALNKFSAMSGLYPNLSKCTMFCGSLNKDAKREISSIFPFKEGKLPVRYLGVPLITKKISVKECKQLVDKVSQKLNDWKNKSLSYARRAQLIASILGSMQVYWGSVFLLPKTIVNDIEKLFKRFLWNNGDSCKGKAKVAWLDVCKPNDQGGLGFKPLELWNKTLLSVWDVNADNRDSWRWKCLLDLRGWISNHMRYKIVDRWTIVQYQDKISDVLGDNGWKWPAHLFTKHPWIANIQVPQLSNQHDRAVWIDNMGSEKRFSTNNLAAKKRLCTHDRLEKWYPSKKFKCGLCNKEPDSHEHLFFKCVYAQYIWKKICRMAKLKLKEDNWGNILEEMSKDKSQGSIWGVIRKLCLAASVYFIWHERNRRLFNNYKRDEDELFKIICE